MIYTYKLQLKPYSLNKYKTNHFILYKIKQAYAEEIYWQLVTQKTKPVQTPIAIQFIFHYKTTNWDLDNTAVLQKFIIDVLKPSGVKNTYGLGVIPDDSVKYIVKICYAPGHRQDGTIDVILHEVCNP